MYISAKPKGINSNQNKDIRIFSNGVQYISPNKESVIADINPFLQSC
jgi:hypothetical protein